MVLVLAGPGLQPLRAIMDDPFWTKPFFLAQAMAELNLLSISSVQF